MKINHRIQDKFLENKYSLWIEYPDGTKRETNYLEIEIILKDIRFIRHELTNYTYLYASQLSFGGHLKQNYWEFLNVKGKIDENDKQELEEGILLIIYLYYTEIFEAEGWCYLYREKLFKTVNEFIKIYEPKSENNKKMKTLIEFSIKNYENKKLEQFPSGEINEEDKKIRETLTNNDQWVYKIFIENYFIELANSFEPLRKKTNEFFNSILKNGK